MKRIAALLFVLGCFAGTARAQAPGSPSWKGTPHGVSLACTGSATGFNFYRGTVSGGPYIKLNSSPLASCAYEDSTSNANGPSTSTTYFYVATAVDASGNESAYSGEASVVTPATFPANPSAPAKPVATIN